MFRTVQMMALVALCVGLATGCANQFDTDSLEFGGGPVDQTPARQDPQDDPLADLDPFGGGGREDETPDDGSTPTEDPDNPPTECEEGEADDLAACALVRCDEAPEGQLDDCLIDRCEQELSELSETCLGCMAAFLDDGLETLLDACVP